MDGGFPSELKSLAFLKKKGFASARHLSAAGR